MNKFITLLFSLLLTTTAQAYDFSNINRAFRTFLNDDLTLVSGDIEPSLGDYWHLTSHAVNTLVNDPTMGYKVIHMCDYDYRGEEIPVTWSTFTLNNRGDTKQFFVSGYYFVTHTSPITGKTQNLIIQTGRDQFQIYAQNIHQAESNEFINRARAFEVDKNPYNRAILEAKQYTSYPYRVVMRFMDNVGDINASWGDLILDKNLKELSFDQTEGFMSRVSHYKQNKVNMKKGILLAGPPGTGKSFLAEVIISSILRGDLQGKATMVVVTARHLQDTANFRIIYGAARKLSPTTIFMEDIDLLGVKNRTGGQGDFVAETRLNEMLNGIDGLIDANHILTVGTTNRIDYVDGALTRSMRLGQHIYYGLPTLEERRLFFNRFGTKMATWAPDVNDIWLAGLTEGMSGADIIEIIRLTKKEALLADSWNGELLHLTQAHFLAAVDLLKRDHDADNGGGSFIEYTQAVGRLIKFNKVQRQMSLQSLQR
jgi:ATP-dependent 26S proteasome regulatory subunit